MLSFKQLLIIVLHNKFSTDEKVGGMDEAHDSVVWSLSWHPLGHILASGSNDHTWLVNC